MTTSGPAVRSLQVEKMLAAIVLGGIIYCAIFLGIRGYLPPPFFYEPSDTFADWFNPGFWARQEGTYDTWATVYPPLSFVFLRLFGIDSCYPAARSFEASAGLAARDCDWIGLVMLGGLFVFNLLLTWKTFRKIDPETAPMRTICVGLGMPMLVGLERGNLLLIAYTFLLLAMGPLIASARLRWLFAGLAVNFKIYLIGALAALLLKRRWLWVEGAMLATLLVYLLSLAAFGAGTPMEMYRNLTSFSELTVAQILDAWSGFTYLPLYEVVITGSFPLMELIGSDWVGRLEVLLPGLRRFTQLVILLAALAIWWQPQRFSPYRAVALAILMALETVESGIYTYVFVAPFVLMEPWRGGARIWAIVATYFIAFPFDFPLDYLPESPRDLYFADKAMLVSNQITLGPFVRPLLIMTVAWALSLATFVELWRWLKKAWLRPQEALAPSTATEKAVHSKET